MRISQFWAAHRYQSSLGANNDQAELHISSDERFVVSNSTIGPSLIAKRREESALLSKSSFDFEHSFAQTEVSLPDSSKPAANPCTGHGMLRGEQESHIGHAQVRCEGFNQLPSLRLFQSTIRRSSVKGDLPDNDRI